MEINKLYHKDCLEFLKDVKDETFDLIIADPPYFHIKGDFDFAWSNYEEYIEWSKKWILECKRVLKKNGSMYIWGKIGYNKGLSFLKIAIWLEENAGFKIVNWITQRNTRGRGNKKGFIEAREELLFLVKSSCESYTWNNSYLPEINDRRDKGFDGKERKNRFKRTTDVWYDISEASQSSKQRFRTKTGRKFETVKNILLCNRIVEASSNEKDIVYVPFAGSGSEVISCVINNRDWVATEIDEEYCELANSRILNEVENKKTL
jgi:site-specific DNA-methyltransferase (adenine-specific)